MPRPASAIRWRVSMGPAGPGRSADRARPDVAVPSAPTSVGAAEDGGRQRQRLEGVTRPLPAARLQRCGTIERVLEGNVAARTATTWAVEQDTNALPARRRLQLARVGIRPVHAITAGVDPARIQVHELHAAILPPAI